jgi:transposase
MTALKQRFCLEIAAGKSYLQAAVDANIGLATATAWFRESGLTRAPGKKGRPMSPERKRAIERMLSGGMSVADVIRTLGCTRKTVMLVREGMEVRDAAE